MACYNGISLNGERSVMVAMLLVREVVMHADNAKLGELDK